MATGGLKIQRRPPVRRRSLYSGHSLYTPDKKKPSISEEVKRMSNNIADCPEEVNAESSGQQDFDSDDDLFGEYDSFAEDPSLLAQMDYLEDQCKQAAVATLHVVIQNPELSYQFGTPVNPSKSTVREEEFPKLQQNHDSKPLTEDIFDELPCSQLHCYEDANPNSPTVTNAEGQPSVCSIEDVGDAYTSIASHIKPKDEKRKSLRDSLKTTLAGNAKAHIPQISRTKQIKETVIMEELDVAQKTVETSSEIDLGPFYGLPSKVADLIEQYRGIKKLYDWQHACLTLESLQQRKNLIYSLPTSGGKTLVAEIVILQELLCRKRDVLMILPYVAIVQEKVRGLASFGVELEFLIEEYAGSKGRFPPIKRRVKNSLYIATIEKSHSLVNSLIETERIGDLGLVVVDELHMLSEGSRGAVLEMTLTKILCTSEGTQIIGMSATLNNVGELQQFLKADYYTDNFRPVELKEYVKLRDGIYAVDIKAENNFTLSRLLNYKYSSNMLRMDPDHIIALVTEVIPNHSCLIFCPTKKNCENVAEMICKYLNKTYLSHRTTEKKALIEDLKSSGNGTICSVLRRTVPFGIAYHHSGLTSDERKLVEEAYSSGVLCLLTCTSTLAAGVNLPARRVILRAPYVAKDFLKRAQYKQMIGRAGRAGIDSAGESILIIQEKDKEMARELVSKPPEDCYSNLMHDCGKGLQSLLLSLIGLKIAQTAEEIYQFVRYTLFSVQQKHLSKEKSLWEITKESLEYLASKDLVCTKRCTESEQSIFEVSRLGQATYKGG